MYEVKEKASFKGHFWFGKTLVPRLILYSIFFIGLLIMETTVIVIYLSVNEPISLSLTLLASVAIISAVLFLIEGIWLRSETKKLR